MIDLGVIITGSIGLISTIVSGWVSWFFARKKYNAEVEGKLIDNMNEGLDFYKAIIDDNKSRLEEVLRRNTELEKEVRELRSQMLSLMNNICTDLTCQIRKKGDLNTVKNETKTNKKV